MNHRSLPAYAIFLLLSATLLEATQPVRWTTSEQREFLQGEFTGVSVTSDGKLMLAPALEPLINSEEAFIYSAVVDQGGNLYVGTATMGRSFGSIPEGKGANGRGWNMRQSTP